MVKLQQQLKTSAMSSKGGQQESERTKKELEKTRSAYCLPGVMIRMWCKELTHVHATQACAAACE